MKGEAEKLNIYSAGYFFNSYCRGKIITRDTLALGRGIRVPAHLSVLAEVFSLQNPAEECESLADTAKRAASHSRDGLKRI